MRLLMLLLGLAALLTHVHAFARHQFDMFFPGWNNMLQRSLDDGCADKYEEYKTGEPEPGRRPTSFSLELIGCLLEEFPEYRKAELASSAVILGLLPTMLQGLGSSTAEGALVGLRRPGLAVLLAAGSPALTTGKAADFSEIVIKFVSKTQGSGSFATPVLDWSEFPHKWWWVLSTGEYLVVGGAVANVLHMTYRLGVNAIVIFAPATVVMVPLWTFLAVAIHIGGVIALSLKVKVEPPKSPKKARARKFGLAYIIERIPDDLVPIGNQRPRSLGWRTEKVAFFYGFAWFLNLVTIVHVLIGTMTLSSLLFFSPEDSIHIVGRYMLSVVACRAVLRLELSGLRFSVEQAYGQTTLDEGCDLTLNAK